MTNSPPSLFSGRDYQSWVSHRVAHGSHGTVRAWHGNEPRSRSGHPYIGHANATSVQCVLVAASFELFVLSLPGPRLVSLSKLRLSPMYVSFPWPPLGEHRRRSGGRSLEVVRDPSPSCPPSVLLCPPSFSWGRQRAGFRDANRVPAEPRYGIEIPQTAVDPIAAVQPRAPGWSWCRSSVSGTSSVELVCLRGR